MPESQPVTPPSAKVPEETDDDSVMMELNEAQPTAGNVGIGFDGR